MSSERTSERRSPDEAQTRSLSLRLVGRMFGTLGRYKWLVILACPLVCIVAWADMQMIHEGTKLIKQGIPQDRSILSALMPLIVLCIASRTLGWLQWTLCIFANNRAMATLRKLFFAKLQSLSKSFFDQHKTGWLVARSTGDLGIIQDFMTFAMMMLGVFFTITVTAIFRISRIAPILLIPAAVMMPAILIASLHYKRRMTRIQRTAREQNSRLVANMAETVRGVRVVQAFSRQEQNLEAFNELNQMSHDTEVRAARLDAIFLPSLDFIGILNITVVVAFAAWLIKHPDTIALTKPLTTPDVVAYVLYMNVILWPVRMMVDLYSMSIRAMAAAERIYEIIDMEPSVSDPPHPTSVGSPRGELEFDNVSFRYEPTTPWVLRNLNVTIQPGETVALVGQTGAGKTTIASLAARFYDIQEGTIRLDGHNLCDYRQADLHSAMGIVLQQGYLFSGSVMDNLRLRRPDMDPATVIEHAKALGTHDAIMALSAGYETEILEGGESISLGQRQVISITRALLADPAILILDEPTSALDTRTEATVQQAIERLIQDRTTIIIAHRLSTVRHADRILVIDQGQVTEAGTHAELLERGGYYAKLVQLADSREYLS